MAINFSDFSGGITAILKAYTSGVSAQNPNDYQNNIILAARRGADAQRDAATQLQSRREVLENTIRHFEQQKGRPNKQSAENQKNINKRIADANADLVELADVTRRVSQAWNDAHERGKAAVANEAARQIRVNNPSFDPQDPNVPKPTVDAAGNPLPVSNQKNNVPTDTTGMTEGGFGPGGGDTPGNANSSIITREEFDKQFDLDNPTQETDNPLDAIDDGSGGTGNNFFDQAELDRRLAQDKDKQANEVARREQQEKLSRLDRELQERIAELNGQIALRDQEIDVLLAQGKLTEAANSRRDQLAMEQRSQDIERQGQFLSSMGSILNNPLALPAFQAVGGIGGLAEALGIDDISIGNLEASDGVDLGDVSENPNIDLSDTGATPPEVPLPVGEHLDPNSPFAPTDQSGPVNTNDRARRELAGLLGVDAESLARLNGTVLQNLLNQARRGNLTAVKAVIEQQFPGTLPPPPGQSTGLGGVGEQPTDPTPTTPPLGTAPVPPVNPVQPNQVDFFTDFQDRLANFGKVSVKTNRANSQTVRRI